jgi:hypothetical protein
VDNIEDLPDRDFSRYDGYWHGFTFIIFDSDGSDESWIRSTRWVEVAGVDPDPEGQQD